MDARKPGFGRGGLRSSPMRGPPLPLVGFLRADFTSRRLRNVRYTRVPRTTRSEVRKVAPPESSGPTRSGSSRMPRYRTSHATATLRGRCPFWLQCGGRAAAGRRGCLWEWHGLLMLSAHRLQSTEHKPTNGVTERAQPSAEGVPAGRLLLRSHCGVERWVIRHRPEGATVAKRERLEVLWRHIGQDKLWAATEAEALVVRRVAEQYTS